MTMTAIESVRSWFSEHEEPVELVIVFGSTARGTAHAESDVDVGVIFRGEVSLSEELALENRLERATGRSVDIVRLEEADILLRYRVARDGVVVFAKPAHAAPRFLARAGYEYDETRELREDAMRRYAARLRRHA
jgi:predicted nucleotidyltransferase